MLVLLVDVLDDTMELDVDVLEKLVDVGLGVLDVELCFVDVGDGEGDGSPFPNAQEPYNVPWSSGAKNEKRLGVKSNAPNGQPGHLSSIVACFDLPLAVMVIVCPQCSPPPY